MLELAKGLSAAHLDAVAELERQVVAHDGGRLKLEWGVLRTRTSTRVDDLLWWDGDRLAGFLGIYSFDASAVELAGMVHPDARRRGIGTALLEAALSLCRERDHPGVLLITSRSSTTGRALALARGATLGHSEFALQLTSQPADGPSDPRITMRPRAAADTAVVNELLLAGFGWQEPGADDMGGAERAERYRAQSQVVELDGVPVGAVRLNRNGDVAGVYGFVIHPDHQGRGIGRDVLRRVCRQALADGASRLHLEVLADNERALGLYTSLGFTRVATDDYYSLPL